MTFVYAKDLSQEDKMLWAAVLRRAIFDYVLYRGVRAHRNEWQHAYKYLFSENQRYENGLGFEEVCSLFGWEPDYIRRKVPHLTRADIKRIEYGDFKEDPCGSVEESKAMAWAAGPNILKPTRRAMVVRHRYSQQVVYGRPAL